MKIRVKVTCPYCGHVNDRVVEFTSQIEGIVIWYCEQEDGGCDKQFGVRLMIQPQARTYQLTNEKILGAV